MDFMERVGFFRCLQFVKLTFIFSKKVVFDCVRIRCWSFYYFCSKSSMIRFLFLFFALMSMTFLTAWYPSAIGNATYVDEIISLSVRVQNTASGRRVKLFLFSFMYWAYLSSYAFEWEILNCFPWCTQLRYSL